MLTYHLTTSRRFLAIALFLALALIALAVTARTGVYHIGASPKMFYHG